MSVDHAPPAAFSKNQCAVEEVRGRRIIWYGSEVASIVSVDRCWFCYKNGIVEARKRRGQQEGSAEK